MSPQREKPWWLRLDGTPPRTNTDEAILRHPARWGFGSGLVMFVGWTCSFRFALDASWMFALVGGGSLGLFWAVAQTLATQLQAERREVKQLREELERYRAERA